MADTVQLAESRLPPWLQELALSLMDDSCLKLPSSSSLQRFQLAFDAGLMLYRRSLVSTGTRVGHFVFADSSPRGGLIGS